MPLGSQLEEESDGGSRFLEAGCAWPGLGKLFMATDFN